MKKIILCAALAVAMPAFAFDVKGISPGEPISSVDLKACQHQDKLDSGLGGYLCQTTYGGAQATMKIIAPGDKVIAILVQVPNETYEPTLKALSEKFGAPQQPNRFIQSFMWMKGTNSLSISENRIGGGYSVVCMDSALYEAVTNQKAEKAKGDI